MAGRADLRLGDCREVLASLPEKSVHVCVTSPPYLGLRDYRLEPLIWGADPQCQHEWGDEATANRCPPQRDHQGAEAFGDTRGEEPWRSDWQGSASQGAFCQKCGAWKGDLGLEPTPELYIEHLMEIFREVWRVLRDDGTLWLNIGDGHAGSGQGWQKGQESWERKWLGQYGPGKPPNYISSRQENGLKPKDLIGVPWALAFRLKEEGWYLRSDIIWAKGAPMPESVRDRPTKSFEHIFLLAKQKHYFYDRVAIAEAMSKQNIERERKGYEHAFKTQFAAHPTDHRHPEGKEIAPVERHVHNKRDVWLVPQEVDNPFCHWLAEQMGYDAFKGLVEEYLDGQENAPDVWWISAKGNSLPHFAVFPEALVEPCILAGTSEKGACRKCGAPYKRIVKGPDSPHDGETESAYEEGSTAKRLAKLRQAARERGEEYGTSYETLGWEPTCKCGIEDTVPCVVLDPCSGTGTSGVVALRRGRDYIGIDASPEYHEMALKRLTTKGVLAPVNGKETKMDDLPLFAKTNGKEAQE